MNYARKRAILACNFCRHRKRRCDGQRPCSTCRDSNADCVYKELLPDRIEDASPTAVTDRLARIEALLELQSQQIHHLSTSSTRTSSLPPSRAEYSIAEHYQTQGLIDPALDPTESLNDSPQFLIPKGHTTFSSTLLSVPMVRDMLGDYPRDYFYNVEEHMPLPECLDNLREIPLVWPPPRPDELNTLAASYFTHVYPHSPMFSPQDFSLIQKKLVDTRPMEDMETAICLCVYALGTVATAGHKSTDEAIGMEYFKPALRIILHQYNWSFKPSLRVCQALMLAASYFSYLGRPLHSWKMGFFASQSFLHYMEPYQQNYKEYSDAELRVFWVCFMAECNRAAELDVPRSGIEPLGDKMPLPQSLDPSDEQDTFNFVAETAIRRLLNRIHCSLYSPENLDVASIVTHTIEPADQWQGLSLQKLMTLSSELNRQLEEWYVSMPSGISPPKGHEPISTDRGHILRIRYYDARHIIHRPFVLYAISQIRSSHPLSIIAGSSIDVDSNIPQVVIDKCEICIDSCVTYLRNACQILETRSQYMWSLSQSCMACLIVLVIAQNCPPLRKFVPKMIPLQSLVLEGLRRWAVDDSSIEAEVEILENLVFEE